MENSTKYGEIGVMGWPNTGGSGNGEFDEIWRNRGNGLAEHGGVRKWRIRRNMEKSGKWAGRTRGGQEMENSKKYGEIGEMEWMKHQNNRHSEGRTASGSMFIRGSPLYGYLLKVYTHNFAFFFLNTTGKQLSEPHVHEGPPPTTQTTTL